MKKILFGIIAFFSFSYLTLADSAYNDYASCVYDEGNGTYVEMRFNNITDVTPTLQNFILYTGSSATHNENSRDKFIYKASGNIDELRNFFANYDQALIQDDETKEGYGQPITTYTVAGYWVTHYETYKAKNDLKNLCPTSLLYTTTKTDNGEVYKFYACKEKNETYYGENEVNNGEVLGCNLVEKYLSSKGEKYSTMNKYIGVGSSTSITDKEDNNLQEQYNNKNSEYEEKCSTEANKAANAERCAELETELGLIYDQGEATGITKDELVKKYEQYKSYQSNKNFDVDNKCDSILGKISDKNAPAYYLNFVFNLIKYVAIIFLFVLTIMDFVKATASSDNDAMKKAIQKTVKRILICIIIFLSPILINFILRILGWVDNPTCGIGG